MGIMALRAVLFSVNLHARLDMGDDDTRTILLIIHPWNKESTGVFLDDWYKGYSDGNTTVESAVAATINDRRLYNMPLGCPGIQDPGHSS